jgi:EAL domain-containing protein (putative c-di-GMP-specific phosphodiesterase class I)
MPKTVQQSIPEEMFEMLERAVNDNFRGFYLVFQPLYSVSNNNESVQLRTVIGYEALARWEHVSPEVFIPLAERNGLIESIGEWVIEELLRTIKHLQQFVTIDHGVRFFFNLSGKQVSLNGRFMNYLETVLSLYEIPAELIGVELTETAVISDVNAAKWMVDHLKSIGIEVALDDFGTGNSGMARLQELNIGKIKIDRSFVRIDHPKSMAILRNTLRLANEMHIDVIVEGIETEEQLEKLVAMGFYYFQGFLLGKPASLGLLR